MGLLYLLEATGSPVESTWCEFVENISRYAGKRMIIDGQMILYKESFYLDDPEALDERMLKFHYLLIRAGVKVIWVFDGKPSKAKRQEIDKRAKKRALEDERIAKLKASFEEARQRREQSASELASASNSIIEDGTTVPSASESNPPLSLFINDDDDDAATLIMDRDTLDEKELVNALPEEFYLDTATPPSSPPPPSASSLVSKRRPPPPTDEGERAAGDEMMMMAKKSEKADFDLLAMLWLEAQCYQEEEKRREEELERSMGRRIRVTAEVTKRQIRMLSEVAEARVIQAPDDSEKLCAYACSQGWADVAASSDWDSAAFGAKVFVRNLNPHPPFPRAITPTRSTPEMPAAAAVGKKRKRAPKRKTFARHEMHEVNLDRLLKHLSLTLEEFRHLAILCHCDFTPGIPGVGGVKALKFIQRHRSIPAFLASAEGADYRTVAERCDWECAMKQFRCTNLIKRHEHLAAEFQRMLDPSWPWIPSWATFTEKSVPSSNLLIQQISHPSCSSPSSSSSSSLTLLPESVVFGKAENHTSLQEEAKAKDDGDGVGETDDCFITEEEWKDEQSVYGNQGDFVPWLSRLKVFRQANPFVVVSQ